MAGSGREEKWKGRLAPVDVPATLAPTSPGEYFDARFDAEEDAIVFRRLAGREDWLAC